MIVRESISFERGGDPKKILGIGNIYRKQTFENINELADYLIIILPELLKTKSIPRNIIKSPSFYINIKYLSTVSDYLNKYADVSTYANDRGIFQTLSEKLKQMGYKEY